MLILTPIVAPILAGCSSSYGSYGSGNAGPDAATCNGVGGDSTVAEAHQHSICVPTTDLTAPPAAGLTYTSSLFAEHTHTLALTSDQLAQIQAGQSVTVASASAIDPLDGAAHTHNWTLRKA
jgi:hypothetical protein